MSTFKTEAIVLAKRSFIEDDRIYTVYSKSCGQLEVMVKAAARSTSKLAGHLEPFSVTQLMIARGRNLEKVAGANLVAAYHYGDWGSYTLASFASEVVIKLTKPGLADKRIYEILLKLLSFLAREGMLDLKRLATLRFTWLVLQFSGYQPNSNTSAFIRNLPQLSATAGEFLTRLIASQPVTIASKISKAAIQEIENYTKHYLEYILESEIKSLKLLAYA